MCCSKFARNVKYCSNVAQSAKKCLRVLKMQISAPNSKKCSKGAQRNRERPICHFALMFANPCRSCINFISPVISAFAIFEIYFVTPLACSRLQEGSEIVESPKLREREHENGRKLGRGRAAPPPFPFFPALRSYFRVSCPASFLLSEGLKYAWINCARKMAYSACR